MTLDRPVSRTLLSEEVFHRLRDSIVRGELEPGEKVKDSELAARLGLSRTPVREALSRLAEIGLVEARPGVWTRVTPLDRRNVTHTLDVLRSLDRLAVETAVPRLTATQLDAMREANRAFCRAVGAEDTAGAVEADDRFHGVLFTAADNPVLRRLAAQLHPQVHRILHRKFTTLLGGRNTIDHHEALIALCAAGRAAEAAELSAAHWSELGNHISHLFDTEQLGDRA
ncbi:GntR family transcriptional regulator [Streptomyces lonarensis]|uniref:GntR family transcriptional regulator n=1 Tax=Streptomyces lonarensis TaxID=700599 RepID=A0A7X6CZS2_9ACTN|nr:GntR family transcriptional regulator [Streptomyces lonarensis]NJQ05423.1 GntR family transcriptional regulator [Streptomyces lonarensis]